MTAMEEVALPKSSSYNYYEHAWWWSELRHKFMVRLGPYC